MKKPIAIIAGEPNSISSEIIFKSWNLRNKFPHKKILIIGSVSLLNKQKKKLSIPIKIKRIDKKFNLKDLNTAQLPVIDVEYNQKKAFQKKSFLSNKYIFNSFKIALDLISEKKIIGIINCPVYKENLFKNNYQGITEFLSKKAGVQGNEVMLLYNKNLAVAPLTTHIPLKQIHNKINIKIIVNKIKIINYFYKKFFNKKPKIALLGLNPHNYSSLKKNEEKKIISPAIKIIKKMKIKIIGPISPDTSFINYKKDKIDVIAGMYHDQVLTPFKALFEYNAINITLGLPYVRLSPDHGIAENIIGKKVANPKSLIESIKFFNNIN